MKQILSLSIEHSIPPPSPQPPRGPAPSSTPPRGARAAPPQVGLCHTHLHLNHVLT